MLDFDKVTTMYVCNMLGEQLYVVDGVDESTVSLVPRLNGQYDLEFDVVQRPDEVSVSYETLQEGLYLYIDTIGYFKMRSPHETITPSVFTKHITAHSCDAELDDKNLNIEINMGTETSQEYLVSYRAEEDEILVNPLNGIPYDWIVLYNTFPAQLQALYAWLATQRDLAGVETMISVDDPDYEYLNSMLLLIPRLKSKLMNYDESLKDLADVVTYEEVEDGESTTVDYMLQSFASYRANEDGDTIGITLTEHFAERILELKAYFERYGDQLSLLDIVCSKTGGNWSVGTVYGVANGDYTLANTHYQFEINETIYSFLTATLAEKLESVVNFDILHKKINVTPVEHLGDDTGVVLSYSGLLNQLDLTTDEDTLCTRLDVRGGNDITLEQVNCGEPYVANIDYKLGVRNSAGQRIYVSDELADKYARYKSYREEYVRPAYVELSRVYNQINEDRNELIYRVPNDCVATDWGTFSDEDLAQQLIGYENLLRALLQCYAEDYGMPSADNPYWQPFGGEETLEPWMSKSVLDDGINKYYPAKAKIQQTMYWWDYYAYHQAITQIHVAQSARAATNDETGYSYQKLTDESLREMIDAWETEWTLYGTTELGVKISAYEKQMQTLVDGGVVIRKHYTYAAAAAKTVEDASGNPIPLFSTDPSSTEYCSEEKYYRICQILAQGQLWLSLRESEKQLFIDQDWFNYLRSAEISPYNATPGTIDIYTWDELTDIERGFYGNVEANYYYGEYEKIWNYRRDAQDALDDLTDDVDMMQRSLDTLQEARDALAAHVQLETYACEGFVSITKPEGKDVDALTAQIASLDTQLVAPQNVNTKAGRRLQTQRAMLVASKTLETNTQELFNQINSALARFNFLTDLHRWVVNPPEQFTTAESKTIHLLYRDAEYTNENILTTSLNDTIDTIDVLEELYEDACEQVSIVSRPQLNFEVDADNMFAVEGFAPFWEQFRLGNYFYVEYKDGTFVKVRMVEYGYNPYIPSGGMTLRFSTMVRSKTKVTDLESVLGMSSSSQISSFGGGGSGSSGQNGEYGSNLNVAISNTMLGKLLGMGNGTTLSNALTSFMMEPSTSAVRRISDALRREVDNFVNAATAAGFSLLAKQVAKAPVYQGLKDGATVVSADCLQGGTIESTETYSTTGRLPYYMAANEENAPFTVDETDTAHYMSAQQYANALDVLASGTTPPPAWADLTTAQKSLFHNDSDIYAVFCSKDYLRREYNAPVSWFNLNGGSFSYAREGLTYSAGASNEIGTLALRGVINATGGDIGGVKIGSASLDDLQSGAMYIGAQGLYKITNAGEFHLRPASAADASTQANVVSPGYNFIKFNRKAPATNIQYVESVMSADGLAITKTSNTSSYYTWIDGGRIRLLNDIDIRCRNSGESEAEATYTGLPAAPEIKVTDGNIDCVSCANATTGSYTHQSHSTGSAVTSVWGSGSGVTTNSKTFVTKVATVTGTPPEDSINNSSSNRHIKVQHSNSVYAALYSNGNIRATGYLRCAGAYAGEMGLTGSDYAEFYEWADANSTYADRRGRFVTLDGALIRLAQCEDTDILGITSSTPTVTGAHDLGEWHNKYMKDEFGAILYEPVEIPAQYDDDGKLIAEARIDMQPKINPEFDPEREYIPRSERPEWAVVGLVGQIIMLQDGSCYPNDYCKSADEGIATKSDAPTNFRVMKRIDDRHILVMAK